MSARSIEKFCKDHGFSRATYYNLKALGKAPVEMAVGTRRLISDEAAERWRRDREAEAASDQRAQPIEIEPVFGERDGT
jgi:hypothetical protein